MALIVEDGSMPEGANSYVSLEEADAYLTARNVWAVTDDESLVSQKEAALIRAFDALNTLSWKGSLPDWQRTVAWPRAEVPVPGVQVKPGAEPEFLPADMVPRAVQQAQIELAGLIYGGHDPLAPVERGGKVISYSESTKEGDLDVVGGDSESHSVTYAEAAPVETYLPAVYGLLTPFLSKIPGRTEAFVVGRVLRG